MPDLTTSQVAAAVGVPQNTALRALTRAVKSEKITPPKEGRWGFQWNDDAVRFLRSIGTGRNLPGKPGRKVKVRT